MVPEEENDGLLDAERHQARHTIAPRAQLFPVAEKFVSVNGEGLAAGRPAAFIRFAGCNMWCTYCDTRWANHPLVEVEGLERARPGGLGGRDRRVVRDAHRRRAAFAALPARFGADSARGGRPAPLARGNRDQRLARPESHGALARGLRRGGAARQPALHGGLEDAHGRRGRVRRHAPRELRSAGYARCREVRRGHRGRSGLHGALRRRGGAVGSLLGAGEPGMGRHRAGRNRRLPHRSRPRPRPSAAAAAQDHLARSRRAGS